MKPAASAVLGLVAVAGRAVAAPLAHTAADGSSSFTIVATHSGSPIHLQPVVANGFGLWVGGTTAAFCPNPAECGDLSTNTTVLVCPNTEGTPGACFMQAEVPGGQQLYVRNDTGAVGYTVPHSLEFPPGALQYGFEYTPGTDGAQGHWGFGGVANATGVVACPTGKDCEAATGQGCGPWQVVVPLPNVDTSSCVGFDGLTTPSDAMAWEYT